MAVARRRTPAEPRSPLSHERILDAAAQLVDTGGASSFSMRQLGERLGVTPMALYTWFPNRDQLLGALAAREMGGMTIPETSTGSWRERALALAQAIRGHVLAHRSAVQLPGATAALTSAMLAASDRGLALMLELGYGEVDAVEHYRAFFWHVMGHTVVVDVGNAAPAAGAEPLAERYAAALDALDGGSGGPFRRLLPLFDAFDADALFVRSTTLLLAAIEAAAPTSRAGRV